MKDAKTITEFVKSVFANYSICYTMEDASGFRRPISFAPQRNLALRIIKKPWLILAFIAVLIALGLLVGNLFELL